MRKVQIEISLFEFQILKTKGGDKMGKMSHLDIKKAETYISAFLRYRRWESNPHGIATTGF